MGSRVYEYQERRLTQYCHYRARRPRQDDAGRRDAQAVGHLPGEPGGAGPRDGLERHRAGARHHDPGEERLRGIQGREDQHRGHPGTRRFRRRSGAGAQDGGRRAAARRRGGGPDAPDPLRAEQGTRPRPRGHRGHQQDRPTRRARLRGHRRGARAADGPRRVRRAARQPDGLLLRPRRHRLDLPRGGGHRPAAAHGYDRRLHPAPPGRPRAAHRGARLVDRL